jgi:POT family proton-dependent oligopeptide transporter
VLQGKAMVIPMSSGGGRLVVEPAQMQALNPLLVMLLIPFNNLVLYPRCAARLRADRAAPHGHRHRLLRCCLDHRRRCCNCGWTAATRSRITWQILPYLLLTFGEVLVSATALEFAYSQAPPR